METFDLTPEDLELFETAADVLRRRHHPVLHQVSAAMRAADGSVHTGLHVGSRRINVCAESSAIANATMAGAGPVRTIVAACVDEEGRVIVTNPCGVCRELLGTHGLDAMVIVDVRGAVRKVRARDLLPTPWLFPHESDWDVDDPRVGRDG